MTGLILIATVAALVCLFPLRRASAALSGPAPRRAQMLPDPDDEIRDRFNRESV